MQSATEGMAPVLEHLEKLTYLDGLKQSMRERLSVMPKLLLEHATRLHGILKAKDIKFAKISIELLAQACLDEGLMARPEFKAPCFGNARAAYVGDALLTLHIARSSFVALKSPKDHQADRTRWCQKNALASFYDRFFAGCAPLPLTWEVMLTNGGAQPTQPTAHQKAEFVEAIMGVLLMSKNEELATIFCTWIVHSLP